MKGTLETISSTDPSSQVGREGGREEGGGEGEGGREGEEGREGERYCYMLCFIISVAALWLWFSWYK